MSGSSSDEEEVPLAVPLNTTVTQQISSADAANQSTAEVRSGRQPLAPAAPAAVGASCHHCFERVHNASGSCCCCCRECLPKPIPTCPGLSCSQHRCSLPRHALQMPPGGPPAAAPVPITLITGYLGAGKTTLVNQILSTKHGFRCAVLLNEIADSADIERALVKEPEVGGGGRARSELAVFGACGDSEGDQDKDSVTCLAPMRAGMPHGCMLPLERLSDGSPPLRAPPPPLPRLPPPPPPYTDSPSAFCAPLRVPRRLLWRSGPNWRTVASAARPRTTWSRRWRR
jgi:hypothetical protein